MSTTTRAATTWSWWSSPSRRFLCANISLLSRSFFSFIRSYILYRMGKSGREETTSTAAYRYTNLIRHISCIRGLCELLRAFHLPNSTALLISNYRNILRRQMDTAKPLIRKFWSELEPFSFPVAPTISQMLFVQKSCFFFAWCFFPFMHREQQTSGKTRREEEAARSFFDKRCKFHTRKTFLFVFLHEGTLHYRKKEEQEASSLWSLPRKQKTRDLCWHEIGSN